MPTLYLLGGAARAGKTTILKAALKRKSMRAISSDALRASWRKVLLDESYVTVDKLRLRGEVVFRRPGSLRQYRKKFQRSQSEDELTWQAVLGLIDHCDRNNDFDLFIEGIAITPQRVHSLRLKNLKLCAVFVGFTRESYLKRIVAHAHQKRDWVHTMMQEHGSDAPVRNWFYDNVKRSERTRALAKKYGYKFFDISAAPFKKFVNEVTSWILGSRQRTGKQVYLPLAGPRMTKRNPSLLRRTPF